MKFEFSEDENLLKSSLNRYLKSNYAMRERRRIIASEEGYSVQCWSGFAELGLLGLPYSEELGGYGGGIFEALAVQMEMGRSISVEPYLGTVYLAGACIAAGVNETLKHDLIPKVIDGSLVLAFAHEERASQGSLAGIGLTASRQDEGYVLNGEKLGVGAASIADKWVVSCVGVEQPSAHLLLLVDATAEGVQRQDFTTVDGIRSSNIVFNDVCIDADALVLEEGAALADVLRRAITLQCAEAIGAMEVLLETTLQYARDRQQFGKPIGQFQVLQHRMADMFMSLEHSKSVLFATASLIDEGRCSDRDVSILKIQIAEAGAFIGGQAIQIHGGIGMTDELDVGHYFKRLTAAAARFGSASWHAQIVGAPTV